MYPVKPIPRIHSADRAPASKQLGKLPYASLSSPKSPKIKELLARDEALHATEHKPKPPKSEGS